LGKKSGRFLDGGSGRKKSQFRVKSPGFESGRELGRENKRAGLTKVLGRVSSHKKLKFQVSSQLRELRVQTIGRGLKVFWAEKGLSFSQWKH